MTRRTKTIVFAIAQVGIIAVVVATLGIMALHTQDDRRCRDALLTGTYSLGQHSIECDHEKHTLVRDGGRFRCVCPNTRLPESATE
jgi:hypothetical protein